jgi:hypothetical protein
MDPKSEEGQARSQAWLEYGADPPDIRRKSRWASYVRTQLLDEETRIDPNSRLLPLNVWYSTESVGE